jgi:hypothetical protein
MKKLLSIPIIGLYLYGITTLTQYGYNSYFNIPSSFVETSLRANIIYFFQLFQAAEFIAGLFRWWMWAIVILILLIFALLWFLDNIFSKITIFVTTLILLYFLANSFNFGRALAANSQTFLGFGTDCPTLAPNTIFIIPVIYDNQGVVVSINKDTKKMIGGFQVKELSGLSCELENISTGKITD